MQSSCLRYKKPAQMGMISIPEAGVCGAIGPGLSAASLACNIAQLVLWLVQATVIKFLALKQGGKTISQAFKDHRDYTNPVFLEKMITHFDIDQYGTCFDPSIFSPKSLRREDFYDR